jgi:hypothetical protein
MALKPSIEKPTFFISPISIKLKKFNFYISLKLKVLAQPKRPGLERQIHSIVRKLGTCLGWNNQSSFGD